MRGTSMASVAVAAVTLISTASGIPAVDAGQADEPPTATTTEETTTEIPYATTSMHGFPSPFRNPVVKISSHEPAAGCMATLDVFYNLRCRGNPTTFLGGETMAPFAVDCGGCTSLTVTTHHGGCAMGGTARARTLETLTSTATSFKFVCAPTPTPAGFLMGTVKYTDAEQTVTPVPTVLSGANPPLTPTAMIVSRFANGYCYHKALLGPRDDAVVSRSCQYLRSPEAYTTTRHKSTVTQGATVSCAGACENNVLYSSGDVDCGPEPDWASLRSLVYITAAEPTTSWEYRCLPTSALPTSTGPTSTAPTSTG